MKIESAMIERIRIVGAERLDPVTVMFEDVGPGQGRVVIECFGQSWATYWGAMGEGCSVRHFFSTVDEHYIADRLSSISSTVPDIGRWKRRLAVQVLDERRRRLLSAREARAMMSTIDEIDESQSVDEIARIHGLIDVAGDDWWHSIDTKTNPAYEYLVRIILTVKDALRLMQEKAA